MQVVMTSYETQIHTFANWLMSHANRVTMDNRKNSEYHVVAATRKLRTDKAVLQKNHGQTILKNIGSEKTYGPKKYWTVKTR